jgi:PAS domain S-box-containing protein
MKDLAHIVNSVPYSIQEIDLEGTIIYANEATIQLLGYNLDEVIGKKLWNFACDPDEQNKLKISFFDIVERRPKPKPLFVKGKRKDGKNIHIQIDWNYNIENDTLIGFITLHADITEYTEQFDKLEYIIKERTSRLQRANNILTITSEISKNILSDNLFDLGECLKEILVGLSLDDIFVCYKNGTSQTYACSHFTSNSNDVKTKKLKMDDCKMNDLKDHLPFIGSFKEMHNLLNMGGCPISEYVQDSENFTVVAIEAFKNLWGIIGFGRKNTGSWSDVEAEALAGLGRLIAILINNQETQHILTEHIRNKFSRFTDLLNSKDVSHG